MYRIPSKTLTEPQPTRYRYITNARALVASMAWVQRVAGMRTTSVSQLVLLGSWACLACAPRLTNAQTVCESCEIQLGVGGTYHFWGRTGGVILPLSLMWDQSRYEFGVFRVATQQMLAETATRSQRLMAEPYWGVSVSRRWHLFARGPVRGFFGFGLAYKTESDALSVTRWDFASQFGIRVRLPGGRSAAELTIRHWSNGGVRLPNHGQDFATLTVRLDPGLRGLDGRD